MARNPKPLRRRPRAYWWRPSWDRWNAVYWAGRHDRYTMQKRGTFEEMLGRFCVDQQMHRCPRSFRRKASES